eukprot:43208-Heterocapsa_arctica.AAC.1
MLSYLCPPPAPLTGLSSWRGIGHTAPAPRGRRVQHARPPAIADAARPAPGAHRERVQKKGSPLRGLPSYAALPKKASCLERAAPAANGLVF